MAPEIRSEDFLFFARRVVVVDLCQFPAKHDSDDCVGATAIGSPPPLSIRITCAMLQKQSGHA